MNDGCSYLNLSYEGKAIVTQTHDAGYRLTNQTLGNGLTRTIAYGRADNLRTADTTFDGATALGDLDFAYSYAIDKQVTAETIDSDLVPDASFTASYDDGNRVTGWDRPGAPGTIRNTQNWNYDDAGNWDSTTVDGTAENRSHTTADQISLLAGEVVTNDIKGNLTAFTHDKPTLIGPVSTDYILEWDLDNRLKKATVENDDVEYRYDALGRRVIRKEGTAETALVWWGNSENAEYEHATGQSCIQNDIFCHPGTLNSVIARAIDGDENDLEWYHKNYLDHIYAVSDDTGGDLIEHYRYSAFGEIEIFDELGNRIADSQIGNTITWNTRRLDGLTGFYLYKYRHYSPQLGRWPSRDPIEESGGINLYAFVGNDGVNRWDVLGAKPCCCPTFAIGTVRGRKASELPGPRNYLQGDMNHYFYAVGDSPSCEMSQSFYVNYIEVGHDILKSKPPKEDGPPFGGEPPNDGQLPGETYNDFDRPGFDDVNKALIQGDYLIIRELGSMGGLKLFQYHFNDAPGVDGSWQLYPWGRIKKTYTTCLWKNDESGVCPYDYCCVETTLEFGWNKKTPLDLNLKITKRPWCGKGGKGAVGSPPSGGKSPH